MNLGAWSRRPRVWLVAVALSAMSLGAQAHGSTVGVNAFYSGLLHPFQNLPQVLVLLGLGIWLGQRPPLRLKMPWLAFALCCAAALVLTTGITGPLPTPCPAWLMGLAMAFGVLIASRAAAPVWLRAVLAGIAAIAIGLDSGVDGTPPMDSLALMLLGTWLCASVLVANIAYYVSECSDRRWLQIGIRITGSWLTAASILVLAFYLKGR